MCDLVDISFDSYCISDENNYDENVHEKTSFQNVVWSEFLATIPKKIEKIQHLIQKRQIHIKPLGAGTYNASIEKDSNGKTTASGAIGYETDKGTRVEGKASVDEKGNVSGKVSVGGTF